MFHVGSYYDIHAVHATTLSGRHTAMMCGYMEWIPLVTPIATDEDFIDLNNIGAHAHIDWRFVNDDVLSTALASPLPLEAQVFDSPYRHEIKIMTMKCLREWPGELRVGFQELERKYCRAKLRGKCPHKGTPREQMISIGGAVLCPAHGLAFSAETGEIVKRRHAQEIVARYSNLSKM